ncbi:MAG: 5'-deoxynucleotidase [Clostridiales bacterium 43-6]|nr:MAG: 5'-deoxynucleotidase [Clostridiales bacterium 43-6]
MNHFFAILSRMKYINRWGLMRNTRNENLSEHSLDVAITAHALAIIGNRYFGKSYDPDRAAALSMFHDTAEIITGDLPTPVKYFNPEINKAYQKIEGVATEKLLSYLPGELKEDYAPYFHIASRDEALKPLIKAADKITALIKCIEEQKMGNSEFSKAALSIRKAIDEMKLPEADHFIKEFLDSFSLTLDEQE